MKKTDIVLLEFRISPRHLIVSAFVVFIIHYLTSLNVIYICFENIHLYFTTEERLTNSYPSRSVTHLELASHTTPEEDCPRSDDEFGIDRPSTSGFQPYYNPNPPFERYLQVL
uniref:Uncharacterized protein n=1 Tax=Heterorhabditis bacteriophora TaxID=37862 RepID=A0A1I7WVI3_HETBA